MDPIIQERRRWPRTESEPPAEVTVCCLDYEKGLETVQVRVADVSPGGLGICSPVPLSIGCRLSTGGALDQFPVDLYGRGAKVASCNKLADGGYRIGLAFEEAPEAATPAERGIWHTSTEGRTISLNASMCRMLEVGSSEDLLGKPYDSFLRPAESSSEPPKKFAWSLGEAELTGRLGSRRNVLVHEEPLFNSCGTLKGFLRTFTDLDAMRRQLAEEQPAGRAG